MKIHKSVTYRKLHNSKLWSSIIRIIELHKRLSSLVQHRMMYLCVKSRTYKRHCIKIYTCWNVTTIRQLNRPPMVNITLIIQNLVLFFHWMQPNTLNFMQYFSAKTKIISLSFTLCLTHVCKFVENVFWKANKTSNLPVFWNIQSPY